MNKSLVLAAAVAVVSPAASVLAATIVWNPVQTLSSPSVVYNPNGEAGQVFGWNNNNYTYVDTGTGPLLHSWPVLDQFAFAAPNNVNAYGVPYLSMGLTGGQSAGGGIFISGTPSGWNADLVTIMGGAYWQDGGSIGVTLSNLQIGQTYEVQFFAGDNRPIGLARSQTITSGSSTSGTMTFGNNWGADFATAVLGTFTADSTSQAFTLDGANVMVNAIMVTAVPEPATLAILGGGCALAAVAVRRRRYARTPIDG